MFLAVVVGQVLARLLDPFGWAINIVLVMLAKRHLPRWLAVAGSAAASALVIQSLMFAFLPADDPARSFGEGLLYWVLTGLIECGLVALLSWRAFWNLLRPERGQTRR
jgi:hypothetical protein